jgi:hypothetical protein
MALTKTTVKVTNISELSTKPNATEGLTDATFKALFDKSSKDLKDYINDTLTEEIDETLEAKFDSSKISYGTSEPAGGNDGDIYFQYEE